MPGVYAEADDIEESIDDVMDVDPTANDKNIEPIEATEWPDPNDSVIASLDKDSDGADNIAENQEDVDQTRSGT